MSRSACSGSTRSASSPIASIPALASTDARSWMRSVVDAMATEAPRPPMILAVAKPIPSGLPLPVMSATRPSSDVWSRGLSRRPGCWVRGDDGDRWYPRPTTPMNRDLDHRDGPRDECGVFGVFAPERDVARLAYFALFALQHRGQESAGIAATQAGQIMTVRDLGLVSQVFDEEKLRALQGEMAIGHVRYSTTGSSAWENAQPVWRSDRRQVALAHNGNLINAVE